MLGMQLNLSAKIIDLVNNTWSWYPDLMLGRRITLCREQGEDLSKCGVDGNLKLSSRVCGRPVAELVECKELKLLTACPCSQPPAFKRKRCTVHCVDRSSSAAGEAGRDLHVILSHRRHRIMRTQHEAEPYQVQLAVRENIDDEDKITWWANADQASPEILNEYWAKQEENGYVAAKSAPGDLAASTCATHKESSKGYAKLVRQGRLSGWLFAVTSNGFILHAKRFVGAESISQRYFFIAELANRLPELALVIHDDACHVRRFADKHAHRSDLGKRLEYPTMKYIVDRLHAKGHVDPWCLANCHPDVPGNAELLDAFKTSASETVNSKLARHKFALRFVKGLVASFYLQEVIDTRNVLDKMFA